METGRGDEKPKWLSSILAGNSDDRVEDEADDDPSSCSPSRMLQRVNIDRNQTKTNAAHSEAEGSEKVKTKLMSMWNNMKYGWTVKVKTNFSYESPIWLLGKCYHKKLQGQDGSEFPVRNASMELFKQDFSSRIWFTYRREFPTLAGSNLTTDCGWGCMLRSGQMLLAQALVCHVLGREWKWSSSQIPQNDVYHRMIIEWFADHPCSRSPFSLHKLVSLGENSGKKAGEWYGPASVAYILKQAAENAAKEIPLLDSICVYVAQDCTIYQQDVFDLCTTVTRKRSFCKDSMSDEKQNLLNKSYCCDNKNDVLNIHDDSTSYQVKNSSISTKIPNNIPKEVETQELHNAFSIQENIQNVYKELSNSYIINPCMFNDNARKTFSTFDQDRRPPNNHSTKIDWVEDNSKVKSSSFHDLETKNEDVSKSGCSSTFYNYVNSSTKLEGKNIRQKKSSYSERRSHMLRSTSVPPPSSEESYYSPAHENHNGECKTESKDFLCNSSSTSGECCSRWKSTIILVPVRLGGEILNRTYIPRVRDMLTQEHCIGIIGGRPRHSLYFIGWQEDKLIYLDPHYCQEVVDVCTADFPVQSFHCTTPRKMTCTRMDPSCTIGFYCKTKKDFLNFTKSINQILAPYKQKGDYPIFTIQEGRCTVATIEREIAGERLESLDRPWSYPDADDTIEINSEDFVVI